MKANLRRKLVVSVATAVMTACCLTSTTYAWFAKNANAWTDEFEVKLHTDEGLLISVDGENYYDSISKRLLTEAIALSRYNLVNTEKKTLSELSEGDIQEYSTTKLSAVSPDSDMNFWGYSTIDNPVENTQIFIKDGLYQPVNLTEMKCGKSYITFDLYFRAVPSSNNAKEKYRLIFTDSLLTKEDSPGVSEITATASTIKLVNKLSTPEKEYSSGEEITINPANAMRMSTTLEDGTTRIYEPNQGYGSYALNNVPSDLENRDLYDAKLNPMYTYFNNTHNLGKLSIPEYDESYVNTLKNFEGREALGYFTKGEDGYNDIKVTFNLWLDGYDADYLEGVDTDSISFFLNFTKIAEEE